MANSIENIQRKERTATGESPVATSLYNLIDRKRLNAINTISTRLQIEPNKVSEQRFGIRIDELSNAGADEVLEILNVLCNQAPNQRNM